MNLKLNILLILRTICRSYLSGEKFGYSHLNECFFLQKAHAKKLTAISICILLKCKKFKTMDDINLRSPALGGSTTATMFEEVALKQMSPNISSALPSKKLAFNISFNTAFSFASMIA